MQVWDDNIIETSVEEFYESNVEDFVNAIKQNITVCYFCKKKGYPVVTSFPMHYQWPSGPAIHLKIFPITSESIIISNASICNFFMAQLQCPQMPTADVWIV